MCGTVVMLLFICVREKGRVFLPWSFGDSSLALYVFLAFLS